jgi:hypothetical protein
MFSVIHKVHCLSAFSNEVLCFCINDTADRQTIFLAERGKYHKPYHRSLGSGSPYRELTESSKCRVRGRDLG